MSALKLVAGNWKMNGLAADSRQRVEQLQILAGQKPPPCDVVLCPPTTALGLAGQLLKNSKIALGGQDCHAQASGAFTGDISAAMLKDMGCRFVIVGHSERRQHHKETSEQVRNKAKAAHAAGLIAIVCVGETDAEREAGKAQEIVDQQLRNSLPDTATAQNTVIAYEPVWAIGTGKTASSDDIKSMHAFIRSKAAPFRILYGGSVKGANAREILHLPDVDGVLVGGASLKAEEFWEIACAAAA